MKEGMVSSPCPPERLRVLTAENEAAPPDMLCSEWKQRDVPGLLDGDGQAPLVLGAGAGLTARLDLGPLG